MKSSRNIQLELSDSERKSMRAHKVKKSEILNYASDELELLLGVSESRAKEIHALADFQQIPSVGIQFAKDLVFLGYYSIEDLKRKNGAELTNDYEKKKGFRTDPCVEDQFRLAADFAVNRDYAKSWWDFTSERKKYRSKHGYPLDRPKLNWTES
ncbi:helix-hairpin-helix domain-containing protein [Algoriphagus aquimarinus]|uniref:Pathogenicity locus n=1 Tax=Algoriphagus aquimarinus TaxID=237018 RepID=A0A5C7A8V4_9BACT|nr:helix-hairpin-helix domain-containing protein [Algoriphagus aquimarinus]TXE03732.1 Pathogenicity locus [Algoriphagus aquimarinus]